MAFLTAIVISAFYLCFLRYCAGVLVWGVIICFLGALGGMGAVLYTETGLTAE